MRSPWRSGLGHPLRDGRVWYPVHPEAPAELPRGGGSSHSTDSWTGAPPGDGLPGPCTPAWAAVWPQPCEHFTLSFLHNMPAEPSGKAATSMLSKAQEAWSAGHSRATGELCSFSTQSGAHQKQTGQLKRKKGWNMVSRVTAARPANKARHHGQGTVEPFDKSGEHLVGPTAIAQCDTPGASSFPRAPGVSPGHTSPACR